MRRGLGALHVETHIISPYTTRHAGGTWFAAAKVLTTGIPVLWRLLPFLCTQTTVQAFELKTAHSIIKRSRKDPAPLQVRTA